MEKPAREGDSPVFEIPREPRSILSSTGHVKPRVNLRRPRRKAKYSISTDSVQVPRGKGEKNPSEGN